MLLLTILPSPITTNNGLGVAGENVRRQDHVIIYTGNRAPHPTDGERAPSFLPNGALDVLRPTAIQVVTSDTGARLDPMSRLNLNDKYVIDHGVEIFVFGYVASESMVQLMYQFRIVSPEPTRQARPSGSQSTRRPTSGSNQGRNDNRDDDSSESESDEEDEDDPEAQRLGERIRALRSAAEKTTALQNLQRNDVEMHQRVLAYLQRTAPQNR